MTTMTTDGVGFPVRPALTGAKLGGKREDYVKMPFEQERKVSTTSEDKSMERCVICGKPDNANPAHEKGYEGKDAHTFHAAKSGATKAVHDVSGEQRDETGKWTSDGGDLRKKSAPSYSVVSKAVRAVSGNSSYSDEDDEIAHIAHSTLTSVHKGASPENAFKLAVQLAGYDKPFERYGDTVNTKRGRDIAKQVLSEKFGVVIGNTLRDKKSLTGSEEDADMADDYAPASVVINYGDSVKSLGNGRFAGYLVRFSSPSDPDLTGDYFTKSTNFFVESGDTIPVLYDHGLNPTLKRRKIGRAQVKIDDVGVWIDGELARRDEYEKAIDLKLLQAGKAGLSSGAASHMTDRRKSLNGTREITEWGIAEASITPTPSEPRAAAFAVKSLAAYAEEDTVDYDADDVPEFLKASHDVGGEKRDAHGRWVEVGSTGGGGEPLGLAKHTAHGRYKVEWEGEHETTGKEQWSATHTDKSGKVTHLGIHSSESRAKSAADSHHRQIDTSEKNPSSPYKVGDKVKFKGGGTEHTVVSHLGRVTPTGRSPRTKYHGYLVENANGGRWVTYHHLLEPAATKKSLEDSNFGDADVEDDALRPFKGIFEEEYSERTPSIWDLRQTLDKAIGKIVAAAQVSDVSGVDINVEQKVTEAVTECAAREIALIVAQVQDWLNGGKDNSNSMTQPDGSRTFYLRSMPPDALDDGSPIKSLIVNGDGLVTGTPLDLHSQQVVSAVGEFADLSARVTEGIKSYVKRCSDKLEFRIKSGRVLSQATCDKLATVHGKMGDAVAAMTEAHSHLGTVVAEAAPDYVPASRKSTTHDVSGEQRDEHGKWTGGSSHEYSEAHKKTVADLREGRLKPHYGNTAEKIKPDNKMVIQHGKNAGKTVTDEGNAMVVHGTLRGIAEGKHPNHAFHDAAENENMYGSRADIVAQRNRAKALLKKHYGLEITHHPDDPETAKKSLDGFDDLGDAGDASVKGLQAQLLLAVSATELELQRSRSGIEDS